MRPLLILACLAVACSSRKPSATVAFEVLEVKVGLPRLDSDEHLEGPVVGVRLKMTNLTDAPLVFDVSDLCSTRPHTLVFEHPNGTLRLPAAERGCQPLLLAPHASLYPILLANRRELNAVYDFTDASYAKLMAFERELRVVYVRQGGDTTGRVSSFTLHYQRHLHRAQSLRSSHPLQ